MQRGPRTLSRQLLILVMGYTLLLSIPIGVVNVWITHRQEAARQQEQVEAVRSLFGLQLAKAVWDFDQAGAQQILLNLDRFPALQRVEVSAPDLRASYVKKGAPTAPPDQAQSYPLMAPEGDLEIGRLRLTLDASALRDQVWAGVVQTVVVVGVEMVLLAILLFALMRRSVTLPVLALSRHVRHMTPDRLHEPAPLPRAKVPNELHELADGVTRLQRDLHEQLAQRDAISRTLEVSEARLKLIADGTPNQLWTAHADGELDYVSKSALSYSGAEADRFMGRGWTAMVHPDDVPLCKAHWAECLLTGATYQIDCRLRRFDGVFRWHALMAVPQRDESGATVKWFGSSTDVHDRKEAEHALEQQRVHLERLVSERTAALFTAKEAAEAASRAKSTFLANMSHEIRTPLNAIVGLAQLMRGEGVTEPQAQRLDSIHGASHHLLSVINDILDLSKIEAGRMELEQLDFSVEHLFNGVVSIVAESARDKGLTLSVDTAGVPLWLRGDATRLRQALLNYAGNGVKFTERGSMALRARVQHRDGDELVLRFEVQDTGIGVAPDKLPLLFQAFEQADASTTRQYGGTGLGLAVARGIAHLMGGEAGVDSTVGVGSTFWFTARLRLGQAASSPAEPVSAASEGEQGLLRRAGATILVAEDNALNRAVAEGMLQAAGMNVELAEDGLAALTKAKLHPYDLVFMDMQMPVMNGLEATRAIRALPGWANTPIVAMTANAFGEDRTACLASGMNDFLTKPVDMRALNEVLVRWLPQR
ncbi:PAS domain-containing hybrid sensor histidine kinase/response regulator [Aquabacterium sp.]|uniref:PAS domain-containing hybrid sensor histidine kinase/response regulator n=1 Tax=Aquabacterium sp. TaxID=1872578 RepID=UPI0024899F09|nr:PAS domain-containing hybrid sensor histidine kinase/response regulator [Aquabacterium sp.]MDI1261250.1 response regulator [Aquabacterium sp.]